MGIIVKGEITITKGLQTWKYSLCWGQEIRGTWKKIYFCSNTERWSNKTSFINAVSEYGST